MKMKIIATVVLITMAQWGFAQSTNDLRFTRDPGSNALVTGLKKAVLSAFDKTDKDLALTSFNGVYPVGESTYVVSFSLALRGISNPPIEKDLKKLRAYFVPFMEEQRLQYKAKGSSAGLTFNGWMSEEYGKSYASDSLPAATCSVYLDKGGRTEFDLFWMKVIFVERRDNYLVVDFTIIAKE